MVAVRTMTGLATLLMAATAVAGVFGSDKTETEWTFGGHNKYQYIQTRVPGDSIFRDLSGSSLQDYKLTVRLKAKVRRGRWDFNTHVQFIGLYSDKLSVSRKLPLSVLPAGGSINDKRRGFNLTHAFTDEGARATLVRVDRFSVGYTGARAVVRFGRQAISWGNGLLYTPMDIFNPFDPAMVDKEYKNGDDMLYGQYLLASGNDIQAVAVTRRDPVSGNVQAEQSSLAVKYHGFVKGYEYDLLLSQHYRDLVVGVGGSADVGGTLWRGDLVMTDTDTKTVVTGVAGVSYSWVTGTHNWSGVLEYYYNGFGQIGGDYSVAGLATDPELLQRLARGELFNLGRHYLGASATVQITPLLSLSPNAFVNLTDPSALAQLVLSYGWKQNIQVLAALNIPVGSKGSEYGGIAAQQPDFYISTGASLFAQLAWYF